MPSKVNIKEIFEDKNSRIFVDTCSLMYESAEYIFEALISFFISYNKKLIVPLKVTDELDRHTKNPKLQNKANLAKSILKKYESNQILDRRGEKGESFADNTFQAVFTKYRLNYNLVLFTQDTRLTEDIYNLRRSNSVNNIRNIRVLKLSNQNIEEFGEQEVTKLNALKNGNSISKNITKEKKQITKFQLKNALPEKGEHNLKVGHVPKLGERVVTRKYGEIQLIKELASGGEGTAFITNNNYVCKIYAKDKITNYKYEKLKLMVQNQIQDDFICWPIDIVFNTNNEFVGYIMKKAEGRELQKSIFLPMLIKKYFPNWNRVQLTTLVITILNKIKILHEMNVILGDINPLNILVKDENTVFIIDTDSFQIENYPCSVGTVNYTAPEIQGRDYKSFLRTFKHEYFAVATLVFMVLLPGKPPYSQQGGSDPASNIKNMDFSYPFQENSNKKVPPGMWQFIWSNLSFKLKEAFYNCFKGNKRISTEEWINILGATLNDLKKGWVSNELFPKGFKEISDETAKKYNIDKNNLKNSNSKTKQFKPNNEQGNRGQHTNYQNNRNINNSSTNNQYTRSSGSLCFISTATLSILGKDDNCEELMILRSFRDEYLLKNGFEKEVYYYYEIAPKIVTEIDKKENKEKIYNEIYSKYLISIVFDIKNNKYETAILNYKKMVDFAKSNMTIL